MKRTASILLILALSVSLLSAAGAAEAADPVTWYPQYEFITRMYGTDRMLVCQDGRYGMTDLEGNVILPCEYAVIRPLEEDGTAAALKGGKWGRVDRDGNVVTPFQYRDESTLEWGVTVVQQGDMYGVMDNDGNMVADYQYYAAGEYVLGLCDVREGIWYNAGYIDTQGNEVIPPIYWTSQSFDAQSGLGIVSTRSTYNYGAVNIEGELVYPCEYGKMWQAGEGLIGLASTEGVAFGDGEGNLITGFDYGYYTDPKGFREGYTFHSGLARVQDQETFLWGYVNTAGELVIPCQYDWCYDFSDGLALVIVENGEERQQFYIDTEGNRAPSGYPYHEGLRRYERDKKWGFADGDGNVVVEPIYDAVGDFDQGYASVRLDGVYGMLPSPLETEAADAPSSWAAEEIAQAEELGLVTARTDSGFQQPITRLQFAELAVNLVEKATGETITPAAEDRFTDTADEAARKAAAAGVVNGTGDGSTFSPDASITREELAAMLYRAWEYIDTAGHGAPAPEGADLSAYADGGEVSQWAAQPVSALAGLEILQGSGGHIMPKDHTTVEQAILLVLRVYQQMA